ncbi:putative histone-like DNA-binding protein [Streptomyces noursei]|nr:putative histone-like DNA-binding protein [Streptomyces noursei]
MNKEHLIEAVQGQLGSRQQAAQAVDAVLDAIVRAVAAGDTVSVTGFGSIFPHDRPAGIRRNPQTGGQVTVPATHVPKFRPGTRFKALVAGRAVMPETGNSIKKAAKTPRP